MALDFHGAISAVANSEELALLLQCLRNHIRLVMVAGLATMSPTRAKEIHAEHIAIVRAIAARDGAKAERLASQHVIGARDRLTIAGAKKEASNHRK